MKCDIILAGVGGQGVLSVSTIIASSAMKEGLHVKQSEVHGMAQRGGAVLAHLRLGDSPIASGLIPKASASMILSMEPLEGLRYISYLSQDGRLITSSNPVMNIPDYPDLDGILSRIRSLPHAKVLDAEKFAQQAGSVRASNMVMVGAAAQFLPVKVETIKECIMDLLACKGDKIVDINLKAFSVGQRIGH